MAQREQLTIDESQKTEPKHPFFGSVRMTYVICGFISMLIHHSLRSAVNISVLCMVADTETPSTMKFISTIEDCDNQKINQTAIRKHMGDLHWTRQEEVLFPSAFFYGYVVALPIAGYFCDKYGGKALFISSIMTEGAIFLLIPVCARANFWLAVFVRVFQGVIAGLGNPALYGLFAIWAHPTERSASIAFGFSGFNVGNLIIYPIVGYLCKFGWEYIYYILGGIAFSCGFVMNWLVYNNVDDHPRISPEEYRYLKSSQISYNKKHSTPWKSILKSVPVYAFIFTHFAQCLGSSMQALMLPRYFKEAMRFSIEESGFVTSAVFAGSSLSIIFAILLNAQVEKRPTVNIDLFHRILQLVCCWAAIPLIIVLVFLDCKSRWISFSIWILVVAVSDIAFSAGYWPTITFLAPSYSGLLIGVANCVGTISSLLVPFAISEIVPTGSLNEWNHAIAFLTVAYFFDGIIYALFGSSKLQPWGLNKTEDDSKI